MNEQSHRLPRREPTQAAKGLPRWRWTLAEFDRFIEIGILTKADKVELIGGELVPMSPRGVRHEDLKEDLQDWFQDLFAGVGASADRAGLAPRRRNLLRA